MPDIYDPRIQLPKSGLSVIDGELVKRSRKNEIMGRHSILKIHGVETNKKLEPINFLFAVVLAGGAVVCKVYIPLAVLSWVISVVIAIIGIFILLNPYKMQLKIESDAGTFCYDTLETVEEVTGFIASLREMVGPRQNAE
jgi:hypothetical protein